MNNLNVYIYMLWSTTVYMYLFFLHLSRFSKFVRTVVNYCCFIGAV